MLNLKNNETMKIIGELPLEIIKNLIEDNENIRKGFDNVDTHNVWITIQIGDNKYIVTADAEKLREEGIIPPSKRVQAMINKQYEALDNAVKDLLHELGINQIELEIMANGDSPYYAGIAEHYNIVPKSRVQLSTKTASKLYNTLNLQK